MLGFCMFQFQKCVRVLFWKEEEKIQENVEFYTASKFFMYFSSFISSSDFHVSVYKMIVSDYKSGIQ